MSTETRPRTALTFQPESFRAVYPELAVWLPAYWGEVAYLRHHAAFAVDLERYGLLEDAEQLLCITARTPEGQAVGLFLAVLGTHNHAKEARCAFGEGLYLQPQVRQGWTAPRFWRAMERCLRAQGIAHLILTSTLEYDVAPFYTRMGAVPIETVYYKYLGEGEAWRLPPGRP